MNYVYDIVLNLSDKLYNFYEWNSDDNVELYVKIPIIKVEEETIKDLRETIIRYQKRGWPPAKRKGIALGLTPLQADIFTSYQGV